MKDRATGLVDSAKEPEGMCRWRWRAWFSIAALATACGGTSGGPPPTPSVRPTSSPQLVSTPAGTPSPSATPTSAPTGGVDEPEHLLAVRLLPYGPDGSETVILRYERGAWQEVAPGVSDGAGDLWVFGTSFSSASTAWAFGQFGFEGGPPLILKSTDAGQTWEDLSSILLPGDGQGLVRFMSFSDSMTGWLNAPPQFSGLYPNVFGTQVTRDGGETWERTDDCRGLRIRFCSGEAQCVVGDDVFPLGPAPGSESYCGPVFGEGQVRAFDARRDGTGIACGTMGERPFCNHTLDSGLTWIESELPEELTELGMIYITSAILTEDGEAWATANGTLSSPPLLSTFIHSEDRGRTWRLFGETAEDRTLDGLSRSSAVVDQGWLLDEAPIGPRRVEPLDDPP